MLVSFRHDEPRASAEILAMEAFDMELACAWHESEPSFNVHTDEARVFGNKVVVPIDGIDCIDDVQEICRVRLEAYAE